MDRNSYIVQIPVMDTYWTLKLSKEGNSINTNGAVIGFISVLVLFLMGVLIYVQMGLFKKKMKTSSILPIFTRNWKG